MFPLMILGVVLSFAASALFIWLCVIAFKESVVWGLVCLFVPLGNVVFAIKHWEVSKKPFLSGLACSVLAVVAMFGAFAVGATQLTQQAMNDPEFQQAIADLEQMQFEPEAEQEVAAVLEEIEAPRETEDAEQPDEAPAAKAGAEETPAPVTIGFPRSSKRAGVNRDAIRFDQASKHLGETVRVVTHDGVDMIVTLSHASDNSIVFERHFTGGAATFEMTQSEIESLEIVRR